MKISHVRRARWSLASIRTALLVLATMLAAACSDSGLSGSVAASGAAGTGGTTGSTTGTTSGTVTTPADPKAATIRVVSNRADLISGGDALVEVLMPSGSDVSQLSMSLDGRDVTTQFAKRANGRVMAQLNGLSPGSNTLTARLANGPSSSAVLFNHPNGGPVLAGPQQSTYLCSNIAKASNAACDQSAEYSYLYKSTDPTKSDLQPYDPANPPTDVATTTTDGGVTVPFIVRREFGYQDRDQYVILQLFDMSKDWKPWAPQVQWNHKLLITHGGSCGTSFTDSAAPLEDYSGTFPPNPALQNSYVTALGLGFAVASTALDNLGHNCSLVTGAESLVMVKERLIEQYGELRYTLGTGCSGGSITQQHVANAFPGIYQGLIVTCSYADVFTTAVQFADAHLLRAFFEDPTRWGTAYTPQNFADVEGYFNHANAIVADEAFFKTVTNPANPSCAGVSAGVGPDKLYNASTNPGGTRCGILDYMINVFAPRDQSVWQAQEKLLGHGFGGFPADTVGVQYGLSALQAGKITADQFVDVNQKIGGLDVDFNLSPNRIVADQPALANAYRTGAVNVGTNLDLVPIIDGRGPDPGIAHDAVHVFMMRARLDQVHGTHANQAIWEGPVPLLGDAMFALNALPAMDRWVSAIEADTTTKPLAKKVLDDRPGDIADACYDGAGTKLTDGLCPDAVVPVYATPRLVAGDALTAVTNKCQLKPLNKSDDYGLLGLSDAQFATLKKVFPDGVCDFSKPPVSYGPTIPWLTYQDVTGKVVYGGTPLPAVTDNSGSGWASPGFGVFGTRP